MVTHINKRNGELVSARALPEAVEVHTRNGVASYAIGDYEIAFDSGEVFMEEKLAFESLFEPLLAPTSSKTEGPTG